MTRLLPIAAAVLAAALAGCGSSSNSSSSGSGSGSTGSSQGTQSSGGGTVIHMQNIQFNPKTITVKVGQTIKWDNLDNVDHNVTATSGASFKSKNFGNGGTFTFTPTKAGTIKYVCTLHPGMDGEIVVTG